MVLKLTDDSKCSVANALVWPVSTKNALHNNLRYSPNQLVFGKNPILPLVLTAKPPALRSCTDSQLLAEHLNALHAARTAFIANKHQERSNLPYKSRHMILQVSLSIYVHRCTTKGIMEKPGMDLALLLE